MDAESGEDENMTWQVHEGDKNGEADEMNVEDETRWCISESDVLFPMKRIGGQARLMTT